MKYNYILFVGHDFLYHQYKELNNLDNVLVVQNGIIRGGELFQKLHKIHWSYMIYQKIRLPFKSLWFKRMTDGRFNNNNPTCFVFFSGQYCCQDTKLVSYIRKLNPDNKIVAFYTDLLEKHGKSEGFEELKNKCDFICTYDKSDAQKYGVECYSTQTYSATKEVTKPDNFTYDLYFVGYAKDRLQKIYEVYDYTTSNGVKCLFQLVGHEGEKRNCEGLVYLDRQIPYTEIVDNIQNSRCILEITQSGAVGHTLRTSEALCYARKLLSNRTQLLNDHLFSDSQLSVFTDAHDIDISFLKNPIDYEKCNNDNFFAPIKFIEFLEKHII